MKWGYCLRLFKYFSSKFWRYCFIVSKLPALLLKVQCLLSLYPLIKGYVWPFFPLYGSFKNTHLKCSEIRLCSWVLFCFLFSFIVWGMRGEPFLPMSFCSEMFYDVICLIITSCLFFHFRALFTWMWGTLDSPTDFPLFSPLSSQACPTF